MRVNQKNPVSALHITSPSKGLSKNPPNPISLVGLSYFFGDGNTKPSLLDRRLISNKNGEEGTPRFFPAI